MESSVHTEASAERGVNWRQVGMFLGLTFGLTYLLNFVLWQTTGLASVATGTVLQFQMLLPAFSAIVLGLFFFKNSSINLRNNLGRPRWFYFYFMALTVIYAALALGAIADPAQVGIFNTVGLALTLLGLILMVVLRLTGKR
ncbi:MAG: hypothetical protein ACYC1C_13270, partial [Chloroflexota bacterium]